MSMPLTHSGAAGYVAAVRAELDDLSAEEVDELTGGLEADVDDALGDAAARSVVSPEERFGSPAAYAAELRAAAGLPPRADPGGRRGAGPLLERLRAGRDALLAHPWRPAIEDRAQLMRPTWWVVRGLVAAGLVAVVLGTAGLPFLALAAILAALSVEVGRRDLAGRGRLQRRLIGAGNALAAVLLLPLMAAAFGPVGTLGTQVEYIQSVEPPPDGLWLNGTEVINVFPYDAQGRPLVGVQLYDEQGRPLSVGTSAKQPMMELDSPELVQAPGVDAGGNQRWNAYPLRHQTLTTDENGTTTASDARPAPRPTVSVPPLVVGGPTEPTTSPTEPTTSPTP